MKDSVHYQFRDSSKLVCFTQVYIDLFIFTFVCHQVVSGVVISTTRPGSPFWPLCVLSACKWCGYFNLQDLAHHSGHTVCHQGVSGVVFSTTRPGSPFWPFCVPSGSKWCGYFSHKIWLTILTTLCAIRK